MRMRLRIRMIVTATVFATTLFAADRRAEDDRALEALRASNVKTIGERAIVWAPPSWPEAKRAAITASLDRVITQVEATLQRKFDAEGYRRRHVEYFITESEELPSHVYGAYEHSASHGDPPYVFLSGLDSGEAPHIHETVHILGGRFGSLLLREGVATYVQYVLQPGPMRPLVKLGEVRDLESLDAAVAAQLAKPKNRELATGWLAAPGKSVAFGSRPERAWFYAVSASFSAFLIDRAGAGAVMEAYAADDPRAALERRTNKSWQQWTDEWLATVQAPR